MIELDGVDIELLRQMFIYAPSTEEVRDIARDGLKRAHRLSRHTLCAGDRSGMHPGEARCWSASPVGDFVVRATDDERFVCPDYCCEFTRPDSEQDMSLDLVLKRYGSGRCTKRAGLCWSVYCKHGGRR